jgi:glutamate racemase
MRQNTQPAVKNHSDHPIGIFDSGVGGLTVAHAVTQLLPKESIIYFGDVAHLPYGDKSTAAIQAYSIKICDMLLKQNCKLILIACNSASSAAYDLVKEYVGKKAIVLDVINPVVNHLREHYPKRRIGLIGTKQTVHSNIFKRKIDALDLEIQFSSLATPLLVPLIEEGFYQNKIIESVLHEYLSHSDLSTIEALILGCTHYPIIKPLIQKYYGAKVDIIDSSEIVAKSLKALLEYENLLNKSSSAPRKFYVSDYTESFEKSAALFFKEGIHLEHYPLWE